MKTYGIWSLGKCLTVKQGVLRDASEFAKTEALRLKQAVFVCRDKTQGSTPLVGWSSKKGLAVRLKKEQLPELFEMSARMGARGGRKRETEDGSTTLGFSTTRERKQKFDQYAERFASGNRSEMFRRMFDAWEKMMVQVVGEQAVTQKAD